MSSSEGRIAFWPDDGRNHFERQYNRVFWITFLGPLAVAVAVGAVHGNDWTYYVGVFLLSVFPPMMGAADLVFDIADRMDGYRAAQRERRRRDTLVTENEQDFIRKIDDLDFDTLHFMSRTIASGRNGFVRDPSDRVLTNLLAKNLARPTTGFRADAYPYRFRSTAWVLMQELAAEVLLRRDRLGPEGNRLPQSCAERTLPIVS